VSKQKQTFIDPKTGEEIESTWLAQFSGGTLGSVFGVVFGVTFSCVGIIMGATLSSYLCEWLNTEGPALIGIGLGVGLGIWLGFIVCREVDKGAHDTIARAQHRRRQRILRAQEHQDVPDTAMSRATPPGEPQPTDVALSVANSPDESNHLTVETENTEAVVGTEHTV